MKNAILLLGLLVFSLPTITDAQERITLADESVLSVFIVRPSETTSSPAPLLVLMGEALVMPRSQETLLCG